MKRLIGLLVLLSCFLACTKQEAHLVYLPEETEQPTPVPTATPMPEEILLPPVDGVALEKDANGVPILDPVEHYYSYYLNLRDVRVYEYGEETFLDLIVDNGYSSILTGGIRISFYDENGTLYGYGDLYTAEGELTLITGENRVYADIQTEVDVQLMDFTFTVTEALTPVAP